MNYTAFLKKELDSYRKKNLPPEEAQASLDMVRSEIEGRIANKERENLAECLSFDIGIHLDKNAKNRILNGDKTGWVLIEQQVYWEAQVISAAPGSMFIDSRSFGGPIGMAMLWGHDDLAAVISAYAEKTFLADKARYASEQTNHVFMASLFHKYKTGKLPAFFDILPATSIYRRLMAAWHDEQALEKLLHEACDFHLLSASDTRDKMLEILAFDLIPYDIRSIELVRKKEGLSTPAIDHPLLATPLANIPAQSPGYDPANDGILQLVSKHTRRGG